jgi:hypothetical protein
VWQSGNRKVASRAKDSWLLGTGPFQRGEIYEGTAFAGEKLKVPLFRPKRQLPATASVGKERHFDRLREQAFDDAGRVENAGYAQPLPPTADKPAEPAAKAAAKPPDNAGAEAKPAEKPKAAYTPPPPPAVSAAQPVGSGPQGSLMQQNVAPGANAAATTAGAVQTYNLAREWLHRDD